MAKVVYLQGFFYAYEKTLYLQQFFSRFPRKKLLLRKGLKGVDNLWTSARARGSKSPLIPTVFRASSHMLPIVETQTYTMRLLSNKIARKLLYLQRFLDSILLNERINQFIRHIGVHGGI
jgi:hypothetical protein